MVNDERSTEDLLEEARKLAGREIDLEQLHDNLWIVLWMSFDRAPPPPGKDEREALLNFIEHVRPIAGQVAAIEAKLDEAESARKPAKEVTAEP